MAWCCLKWKTSTYLILVCYMLYYLVMITFGAFYLWNDCTIVRRHDPVKEKDCEIKRSIYFSWNNCQLEQIIPIFLVFSGCTGCVFIWMCICLLSMRSVSSPMCKIFLCIIAFLSFALSLSINFIGSKEMIFHEWDKWDFSSGCDKDLYWFTFVSLIMYWVHLPCNCLIFICINVKRKPPREEVSIITHL